MPETLQCKYSPRDLVARFCLQRLKNLNLEFESDEIVIHNIVAMACRKGCWIPFTREDYENGLADRGDADFEYERLSLDTLTDDGVLKRVGPVYTVTDEFICLLLQAVNLLAPTKPVRIMDTSVAYA